MSWPERVTSHSALSAATMRRELRLTAHYRLLQCGESCVPQRIIGCYNAARVVSHSALSAATMRRELCLTAHYGYYNTPREVKTLVRFLKFVHHLLFQQKFYNTRMKNNTYDEILTNEFIFWMNNYESCKIIISNKENNNKECFKTHCIQRFKKIKDEQLMKNVHNQVNQITRKYKRSNCKNAYSNVWSFIFTFHVLLVCKD